MEKTQRKNLYDVVIVGGGPAGLTAAIYLARARYRVLIVEKERFGGQITITYEVVNYPGIEKISGSELTDKMRHQAQNFGAEFILSTVSRIDISGDLKKVYTDKGELECFGVLLSTGAHPRMIGFEGEEKFKGHGVAYCATCDGEFFTGKEVFVVGGGFVAAEESVFLTKYASHVTILIREDDFTCAKAVAQKARDNEKITVLTNTEVVEASGENFLQKLIYTNNKTLEKTEYKAPSGETFGIFVFAGYEPATELVKNQVALDEYGYIITDRQQKTDADGIYAAGDVCVKELRQVVTAVSDGAVAATHLERYAKSMQEKIGIKPVFSENTRSTKKIDKNTQSAAQDTLFSEEMLSQLENVFEKMENEILLKLYLDKRPISNELKNYMQSLSDLTKKIYVEIDDSLDIETKKPCVRVCTKEGEWTGLSFHGVPGGHEFTSFILGIYNASGIGQAIGDDIRDRIEHIQNNVDIKIMVSLSCTMCPESVTAAQFIASKNSNITAEIYDLNHFPDMKEKYQVMSVPCMIINDKEPIFGKKSIEDILELI